MKTVPYKNLFKASWIGTAITVVAPTRKEARQTLEELTFKK